MAKNNHFDILDSELREQGAGMPAGAESLISGYRNIAQGYAEMEQCVAVLSDLVNMRSYIYYGAFAERMSIGQRGRCEVVESIWERGLLSHVHPDDLQMKFSLEHVFYNKVSGLGEGMRRYMLASKIRLCDGEGRYHLSMHRMMYVPHPLGETVQFALCLYGPNIGGGEAAAIVDNVTGEMEVLDRDGVPNLLSDRECEVLRMVSDGLTSDEISDRLHISRNTVNRHRQNVRAKLNVRNSAEALRVARDFGLI